MTAHGEPELSETTPELTKDEARKELVRRWRALPVMQRQTHEQAEAFAQTVVGTIGFRTMGDPQKLIVAWIVRDLEQIAVALRAVEARMKKA